MNKQQLHARAQAVANAKDKEFHTLDGGTLKSHVAYAYEQGYRAARADLRKLLEVRNGRSEQTTFTFTTNVWHWLKSIR